MSTYYQEVKIPVRIRIITNKTKAEVEKRWNLLNPVTKKIIQGILVLIFISTQIITFSAYEAHVINVTAHICNYSETRTPGYWKTHPEVYQYYLPQYLGNPPSCPWYVNVDSTTTADTVFAKCDAKDMREKLRCHLLAMKFNIAHFGAGDYFAKTCESEQYGTLIINEYLNVLVSQADILLCDPDTTRQELEDMKNKLDCLNNLHQIRACTSPSPLLSIFNSNVEIEISEEITPIMLNIEATTTESTTTVEVTTTEATTTTTEVTTTTNEATSTSEVIPPPEMTPPEATTTSEATTTPEIIPTETPPSATTTPENPPTSTTTPETTS